MEKIILNDMELDVENFTQDHIRSEVTNNKLIRIKCEAVICDKEKNEKLKDILKEDSFNIRVHNKNLEFQGREGEISYNYPLENSYNKGNSGVVYVLELIEYEEKPDKPVEENSMDLDYLLKIHNKLIVLERILIEKGITSKEEIEKMMNGTIK